MEEIEYKPVDQVRLLEAAEALFDRATESLEVRTSEADLRSDLFLALGPFALDVARMPSIDVRQEGTGKSGRFDSLFGRALVEYKRPHLLDSASEREKVAEQALAYLEDSQLGAQVVIVTDGKTWGILRDPHSIPDPGEQLWMDFGTAPTKAAQRFAWRDLTTQTTVQVLSLIASVRAAPVNSASVNSRLGLQRPSNIRLVATLGALLSAREEASREEALFGEWVRRAGVAYGLSSPTAPWPSDPAKILGPELAGALGTVHYAEALFVLHSYVSICSKLLACEVLTLLAGPEQDQDLRPSQWVSIAAESFAARFERMESGDATDNLGAPGLLASDLFGWYTPLLHSSKDLQQGLSAVVRALSELAWARVALAGGVAVDLLRGFYQSVVPRQMRKALGEFFTPQYLAERLLGKSVELLASPFRPLRVLDPSCGSGTFLVAALRYGLNDLDARGEGEDTQALAGVIDSIIGFDINPVSPVMARVNLLLALGDRAQLLPSIRLHVYHADSILLPETKLGQLVIGSPDVVTVSTEVADFQLPTDLATLEGAETLRSNIDTALLLNRTSEDFRSRLMVDLKLFLSQPPGQDVLDGATAIYDQVKKLHDEDRNGVWARVIEQSLAPRMLPPVDLVIGNPPWISWKNLPQRWKERSETTWKRWGLWQESKKGSGIPLSDISSLLTARSLATYCRPEGLVTMLLPRSVLISDPSGRPFRSCHLRPRPEELHLFTAEKSSTNVGDLDVHFSPEHVDDFTALHPFAPDASNEAIALYMRPRKAAVFPVSCDVWVRQSARSRLESQASWIETAGRLGGTSVLLEPLEESKGAPWAPRRSAQDIELRQHPDKSPYQWGRGYETRGADGFFFCEVVTPKPFGPRDIVRIRSRPDLGKNTKGETERTGEIEAKYVWPLLRGRDVGKWKLNDSNLFCILPYEAEETEPVTLNQLLETSPLLFDYLEPWLPRLQGRSLYRQKSDADRPWSWSGPFQHLRSDRYVVVVRYIAARGRPSAAVEQPLHYAKLGRTTIRLPNNKCNVLFLKRLKEACFVAACLNTEVMQAALGRFAAGTGITPKALQRLPIPKFSQKNELHRAIANLGEKRMSAGTTDAAAIDSELEGSVRLLATN